MNIRKDNLTDAVEAAQRNANVAQNNQNTNSDKPKPAKIERRVVDNEGEIITLGQNSGKIKVSINKTKSVELSREELERIVKNAVNEAINHVEKKLKEKGFL